MASCVIRCRTQRSSGPLMYVVIETHKKPSSDFPELCVCVFMHMYMCDVCVHNT